jgi:predicted nucleic acid-binding protein
MGKTLFLVDTNIIIDFLKGDVKAKEFIINNVDEIKISVVSVSELYAGVRGQKEEEQLKNFLNLFETIELNYSISMEAGYLKNKYYKSHNAGLADCMIAATSLLHDLTLVTDNFKHFPMVKDKITIKNS